MTAWNDFNTALDQYTFEPIPKGTLVKVSLHIQPGGYNDPSQAWEDGYATKNPSSGCIYLKCTYTIVEGKYAKRKIWGFIGLYSPNGPEWMHMGRTLLKGILNSAHGLASKDDSSFARKARYLERLADLDGIEFVGEVGIEKDVHGEDKNIIKKTITPPHKDYASIMGVIPQPNRQVQTGKPTTTAPHWLT